MGMFPVLSLSRRSVCLCAVRVFICAGDFYVLCARSTGAPGKDARIPSVSRALKTIKSWQRGFRLAYTGAVMFSHRASISCALVYGFVACHRTARFSSSIDHIVNGTRLQRVGRNRAAFVFALVERGQSRRGQHTHACTDQHADARGRAQQRSTQLIAERDRLVLLPDLLEEFELLRRSNVLLFSGISTEVSLRMGTASGNPISVRLDLEEWWNREIHQVNTDIERIVVEARVAGFKGCTGLVKEGEAQATQIIAGRRAAFEVLVTRLYDGGNIADPELQEFVKA